MPELPLGIVLVLCFGEKMHGLCVFQQLARILRWRAGTLTCLRGEGWLGSSTKVTQTACHLPKDGLEERSSIYLFSKRHNMKFNLLGLKVDSLLVRILEIFILLLLWPYPKLAWASLT